MLSFRNSTSYTGDMECPSPQQQRHLPAPLGPRKSPAATPVHPAAATATAGLRLEELRLCQRHICGCRFHLCRTYRQRWPCVVCRQESNAAGSKFVYKPATAKLLLIPDFHRLISSSCTIPDLAAITRAAPKLVALTILGSGRAALCLYFST